MTLRRRLQEVYQGSYYEISRKVEGKDETAICDFLSWQSPWAGNLIVPRWWRSPVLTDACRNVELYCWYRTIRHCPCYLIISAIFLLPSKGTPQTCLEGVWLLEEVPKQKSGGWLQRHHYHRRILERIFRADGVLQGIVPQGCRGDFHRSTHSTRWRYGNHCVCRLRPRSQQGDSSIHYWTHHACR